jgi:hypothetical protein
MMPHINTWQPDGATIWLWREFAMDLHKHAAKCGEYAEMWKRLNKLQGANDGMQRHLWGAMEMMGYDKVSAAVSIDQIPRK